MSARDARHRTVKSAFLRDRKLETQGAKFFQSGLNVFSCRPIGQTRESQRTRNRAQGSDQHIFLPVMCERQKFLHAPAANA